MLMINEYFILLSRKFYRVMFLIKIKIYFHKRGVISTETAKHHSYDF